MVASCSVIKKTAKTALQGKYLRCLVASAIPIFLIFVIIIASELFLYARALQFLYWTTFILLFIFLLQPLYLGTLRFFWRSFSESIDDPVTVFYYFSDVSHYKRALGLVFRLTFRLLWCGLLFFAPAIITSVLADSRIYDFIGIDMPNFASSMWIVSGFLETLGVLAVLWIILKSYLAPFLLVADENMEPDEAVHMSKIISKGTVFDFIVLIICFIHWLLLSVLVLPALFTVPYMIFAYLVHARFATARYNRLIQRTEEKDIPTFVAKM